MIEAEAASEHQFFLRVAREPPRRPPGLVAFQGTIGFPPANSVNSDLTTHDTLSRAFDVTLNWRGCPAPAGSCVPSTKC